MASGLTGEIKIGDAVKTLNRKQAVYGRVLSISKKKIAAVEGQEQPGKPAVKVRAHVENLDLIDTAELCDAP